MDADAGENVSMMLPLRTLIKKAARSLSLDVVLIGGLLIMVSEQSVLREAGPRRPFA